jgi:CHAT domain-containing protein
LSGYIRGTSEDLLRKNSNSLPLTADYYKVLILNLVIGLIFIALGCKSQASPDAAFLQVRDEMRRGQLDAALHDVAAASARLGRRDPIWAARFRVQKGHILMLQGAYLASLQLLTESLPPPLARSDTAVQRKMVQGLDYKYLQQFEKADEALSEAEKLADDIHSQFVSDVAQARGMLESDKREYRKAAAAFHSVLLFARQQHQPFREALALGNLGDVAMQEEHYDEAIEWFRLAMQKSQAIGSLSSQSTTFGNMGWNYSAVGDFENAEELLQAAIKRSAETGQAADRVYWMTTLASNVYLRTHRYSQAEKLALQAWDFAKGGDDQLTRTTCLNTLSEITLATGRLRDAENFNRQAIEIENSGGDQFGINSTQLLTGRIATAKKNYQQALAHFQAVLADPQAETAHKWEAHSRLAELFAVQGQTAKAENEFNVAIRTVQGARNSIQNNGFRVSFLTSAIEFYDSYINFLIDQRRPLDALKIADLSRSQPFEQSSQLPGAGASTDSVQTAFRPQNTARQMNATLLFYWLGEHRSWMWVITSPKTYLAPLPPSGEIETFVKSYRQAFLDPRDPLEGGNAEGKKLYETLVQPAGKFIPKHSRVVIFPDGSLNSLNFETLITPGCSEPCGNRQPSPLAHYWIDDVTITTANSLSRLAGRTVSAPKNSSILIVGKSLPASPDFPPIGQAGREISYLEKYFPPERRLELTDGNAKPSAYLNSHPERFSFLHFTAHGTASRLQPLESAIILSPEGDSFKLYARDILQHPLNSYLVTISACNGNGVKAYAGEGLVGLSWAFLRAGAHHVIGGLWEVSNASTPQLMNELYKNLGAGQDPASALRNAKLTLVHSTGNFRRPFYWAPFLLYSGS